MRLFHMIHCRYDMLRAVRWYISDVVGCITCLHAGDWVYAGYIHALRGTGLQRLAVNVLQVTTASALISAVRLDCTPQPARSPRL